MKKDLGWLENGRERIPLCSKNGKFYKAVFFKIYWIRVSQ